MYAHIPVTGADDVVPATRLTGDVTVAPFAGKQMVTLGSVVLIAHGAAVNETVHTPAKMTAASKRPDDSRRKYRALYTTSPMLTLQ